ncbi:membrane protein [Dactylosporangium fulvum]|uniref:General stress protein 17M-like domain-containing protein n=1 Tax=Dactylosporangium fulvum TaxID=53359 RepID=A0ABY5WB03_9ACTN|nr:general stress protein [Dactylosporangium fulvum]UWP86296.1 hypothetical protein Dfulv_19470 [Dactylosporangium fulvum]
MTNPADAGTPQESNSMPFTRGGRPVTPDRAATWDIGSPERPMMTIATYPNYLEAQRAVDRLSDAKFPVDRVTIVGTDVRLVEKVLGRMTIGRAALAGAGSGGWFGLLVGVLLGIFAVGAWWRVVVFAVVAGLLWGAAFGAIAHAMTGGQRDFKSASNIQASTYSLMIDAEYADQARQILGGTTAG